MKRILLCLLLAATLAVPFILRPKRRATTPADATLVIITSHNEAIRHEFGRGFEQWYQAHTGRAVSVDWRVIGGATEISRYLDGAYTASFRDYWTHTLKREWSKAVESGFADSHVTPAAAAGKDTVAQAARRAFLESGVGCGVDVFFGGAPYDFEREARAGHIVDSGVLQRHPECFNEGAIPRFYVGEEYWDRQGRWVGTVLSNYGILYSKESLARLGIDPAPRTWADLQDPRLLGELALADPTRSSSMATAFENVIQEHMQERWFALLVAADRISALDEKAVESQAIREGWIEGLQCIQAIGANARYFTDSAQKVPIDVADGNCAAGMCIDFYGREQAEAERRRGGTDRLVFISPDGGTVSSVDPVALMRGAKNRAVAQAFIDWVVSMDAQKLWAFRPGTPGGPQRYNLRRMPVRRDFYAHEDWKQWRSDPDVSPFDGKDGLIYHAAWTDGVFGELAFIIRVMCQDTHPDLVRAWSVLNSAGRPPEAMAAFEDMSAVNYDKAAGEIKTALLSKNKTEEVELARKLARTFREQYQRAADLAQLKR
jgi:ABC-type Fe3+ transport system substrate-binding protein